MRDKTWLLAGSILILCGTNFWVGIGVYIVVDEIITALTKKE